MERIRQPATVSRDRERNRQTETNLKTDGVTYRDRQTETDRNNKKKERKTEERREEERETESGGEKKR